MADCIWKSPPENIEIREGEVHVWCAEAGQSKGTLGRLERLLSSSERARIGQLKEGKDKARFVTSRGVLRVLLGKYLSAAPEQLIFTYNPQGKPFLKFDTSWGQINFNLAHSGNIFVYGFVLNSGIGIDIEELRVLKDMDRLAEVAFTPSEFSEYAKIPIEQRRRAFFRVWTKKEAFTKGLGEGLMFPFDSLQVAFGVGSMPDMLEKADQLSKGDGWQFELLEPVANYVGALAVRKEEFSCKKWHLNIENYL